MKAKEKQSLPYLLGRFVAVAKETRENLQGEEWEEAKYLDLFSQGVIAFPFGELSGFFLRDFNRLPEELRKRFKPAVEEIYSLLPGDESDLPVKADWAAVETCEIHLGYYHQLGELHPEYLKA